MTEIKKDILATFSEIIPLLPDDKCDYFLGLATGLATALGQIKESINNSEKVAQKEQRENVKV